MPATPSNVHGAVITGWGTALPPKVLTNHDLEQMFETSDEWITERTGIKERHVGGSTVGSRRFYAVTRCAEVAAEGRAAQEKDVRSEKCCSQLEESIVRNKKGAIKASPLAVIK